jgi:hypothetical protein
VRAAGARIAGLGSFPKRGVRGNSYLPRLFALAVSPHSHFIHLAIASDSLITPLPTRGVRGQGSIGRYWLSLRAILMSYCPSIIILLMKLKTPSDSQCACIRVRVSGENFEFLGIYRLVRNVSLLW